MNEGGLWQLRHNNLTDHVRKEAKHVQMLEWRLSVSGSDACMSLRATSRGGGDPDLPDWVSRSLATVMHFKSWLHRCQWAAPASVILWSGLCRGLQTDHIQKSVPSDSDVVEKTAGRLVPLPPLHCVALCGASVSHSTNRKTHLITRVKCRHARLTSSGYWGDESSEMFPSLMYLLMIVATAWQFVQLLYHRQCN